MKKFFTDRKNIINISISIFAAGIIAITAVIFAPIKTYYVSPTGNNANAGAQAAPFKTIQKCLDVVKAGEACEVASGIYPEALTIKTAGTKLNPIGLFGKGVVTVNSGNARTLVTSNGASYYTIEGFRFISTIWEGSMGGHPAEQATINFSYNQWWDGFLGERGNDGFILRNCYVEGSVWIYGSDNLIENCEFNGTHPQNNRGNAITEAYAPSENNTFRNNIIHDYSIRGGWTLQLTHNTLWENNTIYNIGAVNSNLGLGIDCDGAGSAVYSCNVKENLIYNNHEAGILLENTFDSVIEGNIIRDSRRGISAINYNVQNGDGFESDNNYKTLITNTIIKNNLVYNMSQDGILCKAVRGNQLLNNTIYNVDTIQGFFGAVALAGYDGFHCPDWVIKNNIVAQSPKTVWYEGNVSATIDNNFYDLFNANIFNVGSRTFTQWQSMGKDINSKIGNPLFINPAGGDFRLAANSPACGMGAYPCGIVQTPTTSPTPIQTGITPSLTHTAVFTLVFSRTPTINAPTLTHTPTQIASFTPSVTRSPTLTTSQTPILAASSTPTLVPPILVPTIPPAQPVNLCVLIVWKTGLNIRPKASLFSLTIGYYLYNKVVKVESLVNINHPAGHSDTVSNGLWAATNDDQYFAMDLKINNITYARQIPCP